MGKYPSVTQVLGLYNDFSMIRPEVLEHAAKRGTAVHKRCNAYALNLVCLQTDSETQPYFDSFRNWFNWYVESVLMTEQRLTCDKYCFTGKPDMVAMLKGDKHSTLIDFKTPVTPGKTWPAQLAAYQYLAKKSYDPKRTGALMLSPKGQIARFIEYSDTATHLNAFLSALNAYRFFLGGE